MKHLFLAFILSVGLLISATPAHADTVNYTTVFKQFTDHLYPNEVATTVIDKVSPFTTEKNDQPPGALAMFITVLHNNQSDKYLVLVDPNIPKVFAYKRVDIVVPQTPEDQENQPQCSPEEHEQHHGKGA